jgi:ribonuclease BN (tRNA processing enzyme)
MRTEYFPINFSDLKANILPRFMENGATCIDGVQVRSFQQIHQGPSYAYSFEKNGFKIVYATDHELDLMLENREATLKNLEILRLVQKPVVDFVRNADLLIGDGQYTDSEYANKTGWGHSRATTLVDLALQGNVKKVAIFHHDPLETDAAVEEKVTLCRQRASRIVPQLSIFAAREGVEIKID